MAKDEEEVANIFNDFFVNIVPNLRKIIQHNSQDPIKNVICKYQNHPTNILIKKHMEGEKSSF